jgi:hypothetical protein
MAHGTHGQKLLADVDSGTPFDGCTHHLRSPFLTGEQLTSLRISSSSARLLHSGVLHVSLTSFVLGTDYAPLKNPAALPRPSILRQLPASHFISGGGQAYRS